MSGDPFFAGASPVGILVSAAGFASAYALSAYASPSLSLFPTASSYRASLDPTKKAPSDTAVKHAVQELRSDWHTRVCSLLHVLIVVPLALAGLMSDTAVIEDHVRGLSSQATVIMSISAGYFLYDAVLTIWQYHGLGFVAHGVVCCTLYTLSLHPFVLYYGYVFLLFEVSTIFLNIHWFLIKVFHLKATSPLVIFNGVLLLASFAGVRIVYGLWQSWSFWQEMLALNVVDATDTYLRILYCSANVLLNGLNIVWFYALVAFIFFQQSVGPDSMGQEDHVD